MSRGHGSTVALAGLTAVAVLAVDQAAKVALRASLDPGDEREVLGTFLQLTYVRNTGVAFGQFAGSGIIVALLVAAAVAGLLWYFFTHLGTPLIWLPAGMVVGGAVGNLVDRVGEGAVTDYVKFPHWPAFNVADAAITVGVVLMVVLAELDSRRRRREAASAH